MSTIQVTFPSGTAREIAPGTLVYDVLKQENLLTPETIAAKVNNKLSSLSYGITVDSEIEPLSAATTSGIRVLRDSICFILAKASNKLFPNRNLRIGHSLSSAIYYSYNDPSEKISDEDIRSLEKEMRLIVSQNIEIQRQHLNYTAAREHFAKSGQEDTDLLLEFTNDAKIAVYNCGDYMDLATEPLCCSTGMLANFELSSYENGMLLNMPTKKSYPKAGTFTDSPGIFSIYKEYKEWGRILEVSSVGHLNRLRSNKEMKEFIQISEALQNRKISDIAAQIYADKDVLKTVLIAGPSSSGKTTFSKKLSIQLKALGMKPIAISLDNYFVNREATPLDENDEYDFEALEAIDLPYLNEQLNSLIKGQEVEIPAFDFVTGSRKDKGKMLSLPDQGILILEGIHGLNDKLTYLLPKETKFKIYISALTQLNLDDHKRIPTTDNRLIRRMVRDYNFRGNDALATFDMWESVRRGEERNIFPFQDSADAVFNSALDYELGVLKSYAMPLLNAVKPWHKHYTEAVRVQALIQNFHPIPANLVPANSIVREFIGGSAFKY